MTRTSDMASTGSEFYVLLRDVSRSFYLTVRVLPAGIRPQIGLAYLLARTTDTIADTELVPMAKRLQALQALRERILGQSPTPLDLGELARNQALPAERVLLEKCEQSLELLQGLSKSDIQLIQTVLDIITSGQELDLRRFGEASKDHIIALQSDDELDDYTYRVAGCVGEFWTRMCRTHLFPNAPIDDAALLARGVRFGKGLQLVNILRDLPKDLKQRRCYLPTERLSPLGLKPEDLLLPANETRLRPLYREYLDRAKAHLCAGWEYTNMLPYGQARVRLACAWPILIGMRTLQLLRSGNVLDPEHRIKVSRADVKRIMIRSTLLYPLPAVWKKLAA